MPRTASSEGTGNGVGGTKCCKLLALAGNAGLGLIGGEVDLDSLDSWTLGFRFSGFLDP